MDLPHSLTPNHQTPQNESVSDEAFHLSLQQSSSQIIPVHNQQESTLQPWIILRIIVYMADGLCIARRIT